MGHKIASIHIRPCKDMAQMHFKNEHRERLDYIRSDRIELNESWKKEETLLITYENNLRSLVKEKTGRTMQRKASPLREGVLNLKDETTMNDLHFLSSVIEERFKVQTLQIHIHEDEGFTNPDSKAWEQNRHAHMVFDWIDHESGKSIKLNQMDMREMQDIVARSLKMERGERIQYEGESNNGMRMTKKKGEKRHLPAEEYKRHQEHLRTLEPKKIIQHEKGLLKSFIGAVDEKGTINAISSLIEAKNNEIKDIASNYKAELQRLLHQASQAVQKSDSFEREIELLKKENKEAYNKGFKENSKRWRELIKKHGLTLDFDKEKQPVLRNISKEELKKNNGFFK